MHQSHQGILWNELELVELCIKNGILETHNNGKQCLSDLIIDNLIVPIYHSFANEVEHSDKFEMHEQLMGLH